jgi:mono/diheme cytochrome c family protein
MRRLLVLALPLLLVPSLACDSGGGGGEEGGGDNGDILALTGDPARGESVFTSTMCSVAACHGADGNSGSAPGLSTLVSSRSDDQLIDSVLDGKGGMPPQNLDDQQMADVLAWLRDSF